MTDTTKMPHRGQLKPPTLEQIATYVTQIRAPQPSEELDDYVQRVASMIKLIEPLEEVNSPKVLVRHPDRDGGRRANRTEDPYNSLIQLCDVSGADTGPLAGKRIGVKDHIAVAGVPMTSGDAQEPAPIPTEDAVAVERLLDAGAKIVAKTNMGLGDGAAAFGEAHNPNNPAFFAGGSSSGSAAAVAAGIIDAALGSDGGGSIRRPAAWCGIVGMKPTQNLVPSYGPRVHPRSLVGPMTRTVADNALMLEAIAGRDWRDLPSGAARPEPGDYTSAEHLGVDGMRIGVVSESLQFSACTDRTRHAFEQARKTLTDLGTDVRDVSVPLWCYASEILAASLMFGAGRPGGLVDQGYGHSGRIDTDLLQSLPARHKLDPREYAWRLAITHISHAYGGEYFRRTQNLGLELGRQIDELLSSVDLLITPTTPRGPFQLADARSSGTGMHNPNVLIEGLNTRALSLTGHPALSIPAGYGDNDMPTGLQIIGARFNERTIYRAAFAFEATSSRE